MAGSTGLEPATSGVTGQRSNQLNYDPATDRLANPSNSSNPSNPSNSVLVGGTGLEPVTAGV
jgi:hypothetical protein